MARKKSDKKNEEVIIEGSFEGLGDIFDLFDIETKNVENNDLDSLNESKPFELFDHIKNLTVNKVPWSSLRDCDKKTFKPYMITLWFGMVPDLLVLLDELQIYSIGGLTSEQYYTVLYEYLPQQNYFIKYIKGSKEDKYNKELVQLLSKYFEISKCEALDYLEIYNGNITNQLELRTLIEKYGKTDKEINKLMEIKTK